jgi:hypothetical protein
MPPRFEHRTYGDKEQKFCTGKLCKDLEPDGMWKYLSEFSTASCNWDKLKTRCKNCINKRSAELIENRKNGIIPEPKKKNEKLVEEKGFFLDNVYNNKRGDIVYDILCKNNHITVGRCKSSFLRSFYCKECKFNADEYPCTGCKEILPLDKFNKLETATHRNKTDHYCKVCRVEQRDIRKQNGYKFPSKPTEIENGVEGKICASTGCGFSPYSEYWSNSTMIDGYDKHCKKCRGDFSRKYQENNKEKLEEYGKKYRSENRGKLAEGKILWKNNNRELVRKQAREYHKKRRDEDPSFKILGNLRHRLNMAMNGKTKSAPTLKLLGCTVDELWVHLEDKFVKDHEEFPEMTRENYGSVWSLDHCKPCASFDMLCPIQQRKCFNWQNLQPMYKSDNSSKGDSYVRIEWLETILGGIS